MGSGDGGADPITPGSNVHFAAGVAAQLIAARPSSTSNVFFSPLSVEFAMAMVLRGATAGTATHTELLASLWPGSPEETRPVTHTGLSPELSLCCCCFVAALHDSAVLTRGSGVGVGVWVPCRPLPCSVLNTLRGHLRAALTPTDHVTLLIANSLWHVGVCLPEYEAAVSSMLDAEVHPLAGVDPINAW